jgi:hypothetical protein
MRIHTESLTPEFDISLLAGWAIPVTRNEVSVGKWRQVVVNFVDEAKAIAEVAARTGHKDRIRLLTPSTRASTKDSCRIVSQLKWTKPAR